MSARKNKKLNRRFNRKLAKKIRKMGGDEHDVKEAIRLQRMFRERLEKLFVGRKFNDELIPDIKHEMFETIMDWEQPHRHHTPYGHSLVHDALMAKPPTEYAVLEKNISLE